MASFARILATVLFFAALLCGRSAAADEGTEALVARAHATKLASRLEWLRLLHFGTTFLGRFESEIDGKDFFLSPSGKRDADAELEATLRAFSAPVISGHEDEHALCRFPARREWLDSQLHFLDGERRCPALDRSLAAKHISRVSFVYASNAIGNPASAFGHAFLHLQVSTPPNTPSQVQDQLDLGVEFRAITTTKNPLAYAAMGIAGLFVGKVEVIPYEKQLERYSVAQERDLWEYDLTLTRAELTTLMLHLWELQATQLYYYYLQRNCAYEIMRILEVAAPRLDLQPSLKALVFPLDSLSALIAVPDLVHGVVYRPSRRSADQEATDAPHTPPSAPLSTAPSFGHGPMRITFGTGSTTQYGTGFATFGYRLGLHDLTDPHDGWANLSQVEVLDARLRYDLERRALTVDRLTFVDLMALHPLATEPRASWRVEAFGERLHDRACADCFAHGLDGSVGATLATHDKAMTVFAMADAYSAFLPHLTGTGGSFVRLGVGPYAGVRVQAGGTVALLTGSVSYLPWEKLDDTFDLRFTVKSALTKDIALGVEAAAQPLSLEALFASYVYF